MGQQRNGAAVWSGDVYSSWWALRRQVPGGPKLRALRLSLLDHGHRRLPSAVACANHPSPPIRSSTRAGSSTAHFAPSSVPTAIAIRTSYGPTTRSFLRSLAVDRLRYRLLPYVYSLAWKVTSEDYTIQRPLVMDFRQRSRPPGRSAISLCSDPALLVSPVLTERATNALGLPAVGSPVVRLLDRRAYVGRRNDHGARAARSHPARCPRGIDPAAWPRDRICRPGHRPHRAAHLPGADGDFTFYEDEGDSYRYEKGVHATTSIHWDDAARYAHPRRSRGQLSRHALRSHLQCCDCFFRSRRWSGCDAHSRQGGPLHRIADRGKVLKREKISRDLLPALLQNLLGEVVAHLGPIRQRLQICRLEKLFLAVVERLVNRLLHARIV